MLLFRSEEHIDRWNEGTARERGGTMTPEQQWELAKAWYPARLQPDWERRSSQEAQAVFEEVGLTGDFWRFVQ
jgi:hypothetical protein